MCRIHSHERGAELVGKARAILGLQKPREQRLKLAPSALAAPIGTDRLEVPRYPDSDQRENHRGRYGEDPQRQPERSDDNQELPRNRHQGTARQSATHPPKILIGICGIVVPLALVSQPGKA